MSSNSNEFQKPAPHWAEFWAASEDDCRKRSETIYANAIEALERAKCTFKRVGEHFAIRLPGGGDAIGNRSEIINHIVFSHLDDRSSGQILSAAQAAMRPESRAFDAWKDALLDDIRNGRVRLMGRRGPQAPKYVEIPAEIVKRIEFRFAEKYAATEGKKIFDLHLEIPPGCSKKKRGNPEKKDACEAELLRRINAKEITTDLLHSRNGAAQIAESLVGWYNQNHTNSIQFDTVVRMVRRVRASTFEEGKREVIS